MKTGQVIQQGNFFSLYYDGVLHPRQFSANIADSVILEMLSDLMPCYVFSIKRAN